MPTSLMPGLLAGLDVAIDEVAVGDDEQHAVDEPPVRRSRSAQDLVVEHSLVDRDRQGLLGAEADRVLELLRAHRGAGDVEDADVDAVVRDAEADVALREAGSS